MERGACPRGISREDRGAACAQLEGDTLFLAEVGNPFGFHWVLWEGPTGFLLLKPSREENRTRVNQRIKSASGN